MFTQRAFDIFEEKLCQARLLSLPNFNDVFEVEWNASVVCASVILD